MRPLGFSSEFKHEEKTKNKINSVNLMLKHTKYWADYLNEVYVNRCLGLSCGLDVVSMNNG